MKNKQNYIEKRKCEGCNELFDVYDLDMVNGKMLCRECEDNIEKDD